MDNWILYRPDTGAGVQTMRGVPEAEARATAEHLGLRLMPAPAGEADTTHYVEGDRLVAFPVRPSERAEWNWSRRTYEEPPHDIGELAAQRKREIEQERARRAAAPIPYAGSLFDADVRSRERISGTLNRLLRGNGLPAGWVGWRDANNAMHWQDTMDMFVKVHLQALAVAIEDREQALMIAQWGHKKRIQDLVNASNIPALLSYDPLAGWPG